MMTLLMTLIRGLITFGAGLGAAKVLDKVAGDKLPVGTAPIFPYSQAGKINWMRLGIFIFIGAGAAMLLKYLGRKLNIKLLK
jgi:hypothetical protein